MLKKFVDNCRLPSGLMGRVVLNMMNFGHAPLIRHAMSQINLAPGMTALDIGCGGGYAIQCMAERGARVYGVDISPVSVRKSRRKNSRYIRKGQVSIDLAGVDDMSFEPSAFDLITAFETVYFWQNLRANLRKVHELLKPGGEFFIALEVYKKDGKVMNLPGFFSSLEMKVYSAEELVGSLREAGFGAVSHILGKDGKGLYLSAVKEQAERQKTAA